jgi:aspartyl/glutamyl-tRNA(Asn/Gln) amidotransferase C subunit
MAKITEEMLDRISKIARLSLSRSEKVALKADLENILKTFSEIQKIDVSEEKLYYVVDNMNPFREDGPVDYCDPDKSKCLEKDTIMENVPEKEGKLIKVPRGL